MDQSPCEANSPELVTRFPAFYATKGSLPCPQEPTIPVLNQMKPVHIFPPFVSKIESNMILPSMPWSSEWSHPLILLIRIWYTFLISPVCATKPSM